MADWGDVYIHVFILKEVLGEGINSPPLRLHTRNLMLNFYESGHANGVREGGGKLDSILYMVGERAEEGERARHFF